MRWRLALLFAAAASASSCGVFRPSADDLRSNPHGHLVWAARTGDVASIRRLAASGINLDAAPVMPIRFVFPDFDHADATPLQHAVRKHQVEAVRVLLEWGAQPDIVHSGAPPLVIAASNDDRESMRLLFDAGADVEASRKWLAQEEPGGPLWHVIEHAIGFASGRPSQKDVLERIRATPARSRP